MAAMRFGAESLCQLDETALANHLNLDSNFLSFAMTSPHQLERGLALVLHGFNTLQVLPKPHAQVLVLVVTLVPGRILVASQLGESLRHVVEVPPHLVELAGALNVQTNLRLTCLLLLELLDLRLQPLDLSRLAGQHLLHRLLLGYRVLSSRLQYGLRKGLVLGLLVLDPCCLSRLSGLCLPLPSLFKALLLRHHWLAAVHLVFLLLVRPPLHRRLLGVLLGPAALI